MIKFIINFIFFIIISPILLLSVCWDSFRKAYDLIFGTKQGTWHGWFLFCKLLSFGTNCKLQQNPVDWSTIGATGNMVIDQFDCGSCYAIAATQSIESALFIESGGKVYVELSPQYIVDWDPNSNGCKGGNGFKFALEHGIPTEDAYPYDGNDLRFDTYRTPPEDLKYLKWRRFQKREIAERAMKQKTVRIKSYVQVNPSEQDVLSTVRMRPCYVELTFRGDALTNYTTGVITEKYIEETEMEAYMAGEDWKHHAMLAVGMGVDQETGIPFMKFKNSWGEYFGENGYVRIEILSGKPLGLLNMYEKVYYPIV